MNCPQRARHDIYSNNIDGHYKTLFGSLYSNTNKPIIYFDKKLINPFNFDETNSIIIPSTNILSNYGSDYKELLKVKKE
jgi:hypothetical protein